MTHRKRFPSYEFLELLLFRAYFLAKITQFMWNDLFK